MSETKKLCYTAAFATQICAIRLRIKQFAWWFDMSDDIKTRRINGWWWASFENMIADALLSLGWKDCPVRTRFMNVRTVLLSACMQLEDRTGERETAVGLIERRLYLLPIMLPLSDHDIVIGKVWPLKDLNP